MRTFTLLTSLLATVLSATAADGQLELKHHRFSKHGSKKFERLVLEFKQNGGGGSPNVRVAADGAAGEVTIQVSDLNMKSAIPETAINDSYVSKSSLLGPLSVGTDNPRGLTLRTFLKSPQAKVDAFWLTNPARLVLDVFTPDSPRSAGLGAAARVVAGGSRKGRGAPRYSNKDFVCFPTSAAVGMKVLFNRQASGAGRAMPVAVEGVPRASDNGADAVVCYPKSSQVVASIAFDPPTAPTARTTRTEPKAEPLTPADAEDETPTQASLPTVRPALPSGAPANTIHNKSPFAETGNAPKTLTLPSADAKPAAPQLPPPQGSSLGLQLPSGPPPAASDRGPGSTGKPSLNLPMSLPALPTPSGAASPQQRLALPPPQQTSQAPALLPPLSK